jgi:hypothetical protein
MPQLYITLSTLLMQVALHVVTCSAETHTAATAAAATAGCTASSSSSGSCSPLQPQLQQCPALYVCLQVCIPLPQKFIHSLEVPDGNHSVKIFFEQLLEGLLY